MKNAVFIFLISLVAIDLSAQFQELDTLSKTISATIDVAAEQLRLDADFSRGNHTELGIQDFDLSLRNGELIISYDLLPTTEEQHYVLSLDITLNGEPIHLAPEYLKGSIGQNLNGGTGTIIWTNLLEQYINLKGQLKVRLIAHIWGDFFARFGIDCSADRPDFTVKQQIPYYAAAGVGLISIGVGQIFRSKRNDIYNNQYKTSSTLDQATPHYDDANNKHHTYLILTYAGTAILLADATWYIIRQIKTKRNQKLYDRFCKQPSLSLKPVFELPSNGTLTGQAGVKLVYTF